MLEQGKNHQKIHPISYAQQRMWLLDRLEPGNPAYNIARAIRVRGALSTKALQDSLRGIVARHESLRTTFAEIEGDPVQVIAVSGSLELPTIDLRDMPVPERVSETLCLARDEAQRPFDLASGPLIRAKLLRLSTDEHVLVLVMHHIITDAWSMSVLFEEIGRLYSACAAGLPSPLPNLPIQYGDFARWQRESLTGDVLDRQLAYWRQQLSGVDAVLELPTDRARPVIRTARGAIQKLVLSSALSERLKAVGREANVTLFMTLLAAFQTLLWRYTGRDDLVIGSPVAGRSEVELESLIGFFVNTLVIRTNLTGNPTFRELLGRVREVALEAYAYQEAPFEKVVEALQVPRSLHYTPLFQVMFMLQNTPRQRLELPGLTLEELEFDSGTAMFDLTVEMAEVDDGLSCAFEYSTDLFEPATVTRMLGHFQALLEGIIADPGQRLSALPLMGVSERHQLLVEWNDTAAVYPHDQCIHALFEAQAARTPEAVALIYRDRRMTYRELNARANQLAYHLRKRGVGRGVLVGICIERSIEAVVGLLGILKAGGAYVPMDPAYPQQRLAFMLEDSRAPVLLTMQRLLHCVPRCAAETVCLDTDWESMAQESAANPDSGVHPHDLAYVMYTSGSTGTPKGVLAPHCASVNRFFWMWNHWRFAPGEICCQKTALSFVDSIWEIFGPLLQGVPNVIMPDAELEDPHRMVQALAANRVTRIVLVPSLLRLLLDSVADLQTRLPDLKLWITSGEAIMPELARRFEAELPGATLMNLYGSSEVAADVTWYVIRNSRSLARIPIGRPIANTQIYVLDGTLNPVPIGVAGEIHVGGHSLAQGYLNNSELTSQKFIPNPFSRDPEARLYRTGDLGRFLPDGNVEFLGRVDNQVKLRGIRIELGEIETVLSTHPSIQAAVVTVSGTGGAERLIGYVVPSDTAPEPNDLRAFVRARLPDHMVPASFMVLDTLPLLPNGKVDQHALLAPDQARWGINREPIAPRNPTEEKLAGIIGEVLNIGRISVHDNFFDLGGHSLLGIQVVARVRKVFQVELPLRSLFEEPTVAGLSLEIEKAGRRGDRPVMPSPSRRISLSQREQLLAQLAQLSDEEVNALLSSMLAKEQDIERDDLEL
jgi:amino acid adenylation domain-containing protein